MLDICTEIQLAIVTHISPQDRKNLALCCKKLNHLLQPLIWESRKIPYNQLCDLSKPVLLGLCKKINLLAADKNYMGTRRDQTDRLRKGLNLLLKTCNPSVLRFEYLPVVSSITLTLSRMDRLQELYLDGRSFQDEDIDQVCSSCVTNLKDFSVKYSKNTDQAYINIGRLGCLEKLEIVNANISDEVVKNIKSQQLKILNLSQCDLLTNVGMSYISLLVNLQCLNLRGHEDFGPGNCAINDEGVKCIRTLVDLKELDISYRDLVTDTGLKHISALAELTKLSVAGTEITDAGLLYLENLGKLSELNLSDCYQVETNVSRLSSLPICKLWLGNTNISDEDLEHFYLFRLLKVLDLTECGISNDGIKHIVKLDSLETLYIESSAIDEFGFSRLCLDLPHVTIHSDHDFPAGNGLAHYNFLDEDSESELSSNSGSDDEHYDEEDNSKVEHQ